jgi:hypothetical protein
MECTETINRESTASEVLMSEESKARCLGIVVGSLIFLVYAQIIFTSWRWKC